MFRSKKLYALGAVALSLALVTGCGGAEEPAPDDVVVEEGQEEGTEDTVEEGTVDEGAEEEGATEEADENVTLGSEEELQAEFEGYQGVERAMVQMVEGDNTASINVDLEITDETEQSPEELAAQVAEVVKENYPEHAVDVLIAQDGTVVVQEQF